MENVLIFGTGDYYKRKKNSIAGDIIGFVDSFREGKLESHDIYRPSDLKNIQYDKIYIMGKPVRMNEMVNILIKEGVPNNKIIIGINLKPLSNEEALLINDKSYFDVNADGLITYHSDDNNISIRNYDEYCAILNVFGTKTYNVSCGNKDEYVVIDIGMNIGCASIFFSNYNKIKRIYSFEPFKNTFDLALKNIENSNAKSKVTCFNQAVTTNNGVIKAEYNPNMTAGLSVSENGMTDAVNTYKNWNLYKEDGSQVVEVKTIDIIDVINLVKKQFSGTKIILKMDCEGSEYEIMEKLDATKLINEISIIMMEWHYKGDFKIKEYLEKNDYIMFSFNEFYNMGTIYAVNKNNV